MLVINIIVVVFVVFIVCVLLLYNFLEQKSRQVSHEKTYSLIYVIVFFITLLGLFTKNWFILQMMIFLLFIVFIDILFYIEKLQKRIEELIEENKGPIEKIIRFVEENEIIKE